MIPKTRTPLGRLVVGLVPARDHLVAVRAAGEEEEQEGGRALRIVHLLDLARHRHGGELGHDLPRQGAKARARARPGAHRPGRAAGPAARASPPRMPRTGTKKKRRLVFTRASTKGTSSRPLPCRSRGRNRRARHRGRRGPRPEPPRECSSPRVRGFVPKRFSKSRTAALHAVGLVEGIEVPQVLEGVDLDEVALGLVVDPLPHAARGGAVSSLGQDLGRRALEPIAGARDPGRLGQHLGGPRAVLAGRRR